MTYTERIPNNVFLGKTVTSRSEAGDHGYPVIYPTFRLVVWCPFCHERHVHGHDATSIGGFRLSHCDDFDKRDWYYIAADTTTPSFWDYSQGLYEPVPQEP